MSKSKGNKGGLWGFLTCNTRSPTLYETIMTIAKADMLLLYINSLYKQYDNFEKKIAQIEKLQDILKTVPSESIEYKLARKKLNKLLDL